MKTSLDSEKSWHFVYTLVLVKNLLRGENDMLSSAILVIESVFSLAIAIRSSNYEFHRRNLSSCLSKAYLKECD